MFSNAKQGGFIYLIIYFKKYLVFGLELSS